MIPSAPGGQPDPRDPAGIEPATFSLEVHRPQQELHCSIVSLASRLRPLLPSLSQFASRAARIAALLPAATLVPARATDALPPLQTHRCIVRRYWTTHGGLGSRARSRHPAPKDPSPRGTTIDVIVIPLHKPPHSLTRKAPLTHWLPVRIPFLLTSVRRCY